MHPLPYYRIVRWRRLWLVMVCVLLLTYLPAAHLIWAAPGDLSERVVILLDGIRSESDGVTPLKNDFGKIEETLRKASITRFVYFSYSAAMHGANSYCYGWGDLACEPRPLIDGPMDLVSLSLAPRYGIPDTQQPINQQADVLEWLIGQVILQYPDAQIDLVGYSLGGIVASYWASHIGGTSMYRSHIHGITLIESPVGGIALAGPVTSNCEAWLFCGVLRWMFGAEVLKQLQIPGDAPDSIINTLSQAARNFPLTTIESPNDYLVNSESLQICLPACDNPEYVPIGEGTQGWVGVAHTRHDNVPLGGPGVATGPVPLQDVYSRLLDNHTAPLKEQQAADWVLDAVQNGPPAPAAPRDLAARYVILLDGINSEARASTPALYDDYERIEAHLRQAGVARFVYFSYSALNYGPGAYCKGWGPLGCAPGSSNLSSLSRGPVYAQSDTHQALDQQAAVLEWLIGQVIARDPAAQIDLVGYSLGGIVASYWGARIGASSPYRDHIHALTLAESPVGGILFAGALLSDCGFDLICRAWQWEFRDHRFGETVLRQLQLPAETPGSIVGDLPLAAHNFRLTSIQSTADYMVNGMALPIRDRLFWTEHLPIGQGTQYWFTERYTAHLGKNLGGDIANDSSPLWNAEAGLLLSANHHAPLLHPQTAAWILEALQAGWPEQATHASIALIIDSSGSMQQNDPRDLRKWAAKFFIDLALPGDRIAVIDFDYNAHLDAALRTISSQADRDMLKTAVDQLDSDGGTDLGAGLQAGFDQLAADSSNNAKAAIFLTDGRQDAFGPYGDQHLRYKEQGWPIYTIGLGDGADAALLHRIASDTNGRDFSAANSAALHEIYRTLSSRLQNQSPQDSTSFLAFQGQTTTLETNVAAGTPQISFSTSWPGSDVSMALRTPSGLIIDANTADPAVYHAKGATYEVYRILAPEPGTWQAAMTGIDVAPNGESVTFDTTAGPVASGANANLAVTFTPDRAAALPGERVVYQMQVLNTGPEAASDVRLFTQLPAQLSLDSLNCWNNAPANGTICEYPTLAAGATVSATLVAEVIGAPGAITVNTTVRASTSAVDPQASDNVANAPLNLLAAADLDVAFTVASTEARPGDQVMYMLRVANQGLQAADGVNLQVTLPSQLTLVSLACDGGSSNGSGCSYSSLAAGAVITSTLVAQVPGGSTGVAMLNAAVSSGAVDANIANNTALVTTTIVSHNAITFISDRDGNDEVYLMEANGANQRRLTNTPQAEGWPGISADGRRVVFWSTRDGNNEVYVMNADGSNQQRLTFNPASDEAPAWAPDGQHIVFVSNRDGNNEIYIMNADGSNPRRLTKSAGDDQTPSWSADGQHIVFMSARGGNRDIYVMNADGSNIQRLTNTAASEHSPGWWSR